MKKTLKRLLCTALVFILAFGSIFVTSNATDGWETTTGVVTPPDEPKSEMVQITVTTSKNEYALDETITFNINIKNTSSKTIRSIEPISCAAAENVFCPSAELSFIAALQPGESGTVTCEYSTSSTSPVKRLFRILRYIFSRFFGGAAIDTVEYPYVSTVKVLKATGHSWQDDFTVDKEATCTEAGSKSVHCNNCSATRYSTDIAKKEHTPVEDAAVAATCTEDGLTAGSHCSECGTVITAQKIVNATGHKYTLQTTDATCTAAGKTVYTCSVCRNSYSETIPAKGHADKNNDGICDICGLRIKSISNIRLTLRIEPSATINYGETAVIYVTNTDLPAGTQLVWTISGNGVNITPSADGMSCTVKSTDNGTATVTVTAYDKNGNILKSDTGRIISASQSIISKASFIQKVAAFFRNLFGKKSLMSLVKKEFYIKAK